MPLLFGSGILSLGNSPSAFGSSFALIIVFFVSILGLVIFLIGFVIYQSLGERKQNQRRAREYDALRRP